MIQTIFFEIMWRNKREVMTIIKQLALCQNERILSKCTYECMGK